MSSKQRSCSRWSMMSWSRLIVSPISRFFSIKITLAISIVVEESINGPETTISRKSPLWSNKYQICNATMPTPSNVEMKRRQSKYSVELGAGHFGENFRGYTLLECRKMDQMHWARGLFRHYLWSPLHRKASCTAWYTNKSIEAFSSTRLCLDPQTMEKCSAILIRAFLSRFFFW